LSNDGSRKARLVGIAVSWPRVNRALVKISLGRKGIYGQTLKPPSTEVSSDWLGSPKNREIGPGRSKDLSIKFNRHASAIESDYRLTLTLATGCVVELQPVDSAGAPEVFFPTLVGADRLHDLGITGSGPTIAILDTGISTSIR